jgi:hypothetical protein
MEERIRKMGLNEEEKKSFLIEMEKTANNWNVDAFR